MYLPGCGLRDVGNCIEKTMPRYQVVFIDWNKTLSYSRFWQQLEDESHPYFEQGKKIFAFLFGERRVLLVPWMRGAIQTNQILDEISGATGVPLSVIRDELVESCMKMQFVFPDLPELILRIQKSGTKCVVATDNMDTFRRYTIDSMRMHNIFDDFLLSNELGVLKFDRNPQEEGIPFFDCYLKKNGLEYQDVVLIDDCIDDGTYERKGFCILQVTSPQSFREHLEWLTT